MYRQDLDTTDKGGALLAVIAVHVGLLVLLLNLSGQLGVETAQSVLRVFDIRNENPPPPPPPPPATIRKAAKPARTAGGSAPANVKSEATPIVAPTPRVIQPQPSPVVSARTPANGTAPTQGAAAAGSGSGSGGSGSGNGTGVGSGSGSGSGDGDGGVADPPHLASPVLTGRDLPRDLLDRWPPGVPVFLRLRVDPQGYVSECNVLRGTGNPATDGTMCNIAHDRLRFRPAVNRSGQAVAGWFGYAQRPPR